MIDGAPSQEPLWRASVRVVRAVQSNVADAYGDEDGLLESARRILTLVEGAEYRPADYATACREAKRLVRRAQSLAVSKRPATRAQAFVVRATQESAILAQQYHQGVTLDYGGHVVKLQNAAASALWHLTEGGPQSGATVHDAIRALWQGDVRP